MSRTTARSNPMKPVLVPPSAAVERPVPMRDTVAILTRPLLALLAATCALLVAGLYFSQPISGLIVRDVGLLPQSAGLIVTLTQLGYCGGLLLLTPLGDIMENRRLVLATMACSVVALLVVASASSGSTFLAASFLVGLSSSAVQMLVPLAAHMAPAERRGGVVGTMTGGLLLGILLARPLASTLAGFAGWRSVFAGSALLTACFLGLLWRRLPVLRPASVARYPTVVRSLASLFRRKRVLRKRALSHAALFAAFSLFWTSVPWLLTDQGYSQHQIALFALAGAGGALVAPWAGRLADRGHTRSVSVAAMLLAATGFAVAWRGSSLWLMVIAALAVDAGVQANHVAGQREVLEIEPAARSRLNSVYMSTFFMGGALASSLAGPLYRQAWQYVAALGVTLPLVALAIYLAHDFGAGRNPD